MRCARSTANTPAPTPRSWRPQLTARLREVTDEFLLRENHDRPEVIEQINSPSLVPDQGH